jgi:hypothetical protein
MICSTWRLEHEIEGFVILSAMISLSGWISVNIKSWGKHAAKMLIKIFWLAIVEASMLVAAHWSVGFYLRGRFSVSEYEITVLLI